MQWGYVPTTLCSPQPCSHFIKTLIQLAVHHSSLCVYVHYLGVCTNNFVFATTSFARHNLILLSHLPLYYCCFHPLYCDTIAILISSNPVIVRMRLKFPTLFLSGCMHQQLVCLPQPCSFAPTFHCTAVASIHCTATQQEFLNNYFRVIRVMI